MSNRNQNVLPLSLPPRGLSRVMAAAYIGISPTKFDQMVDDGRMPKPKRIDARTVWDRLQVDQAFEALDVDCDSSMGNASQQPNDNWEKIDA